jgi:TfoX/Sxy family transcriptional regulator of competence genes
MSSELDFVQFIADQMEAAGKITYKKMFGDYGIYCDGVIFGLICDNKVFIKPTEKGKLFIGDAVEAPPYPGAKNYFLIEDKFEDREWIGELAAITVRALHIAKTTKSKKRKSKSKVGINNMED